MCSNEPGYYEVSADRHMVPTHMTGSCDRHVVPTHMTGSCDRPLPGPNPRYTAAADGRHPCWCTFLFSGGAHAACRSCLSVGGREAGTAAAAAQLHTNGAPPLPSVVLDCRTAPLAFASKTCLLWWRQTLSSGGWQRVPRISTDLTAPQQCPQMVPHTRRPSTGQKQARALASRPACAMRATCVRRRPAC